MAQILLVFDFPGPVASCPVRALSLANNKHALRTRLYRMDFLPALRAAKPGLSVDCFNQILIAPTGGISATIPFPSAGSTTILATSAIHGSVFLLLASIFA